MLRWHHLEFIPYHTAAEADMEDIFRLLTGAGVALSTGFGP